MFKPFLIAVLATISLSLQAQVQINGIASLIKGAGYYDNHAVLSGGGISMRYMVKESVFIGGAVRTYHGATTSYESYDAQDKANNLSATVDYVFLKRQKVQPYLGLGVGVSKVTHMINYIRVNRNFTMYQLRGGTHISIGKSTGFFAQAEYNYTPGNGSPSPLDGIRNPVLTEPISKYIAVDCGLFIRLYMRQ